MATKLFIRDTKTSGIGVYRDLLAAAGAAAATGIVNTIASGTEIQWTKTAGGELVTFISGRAPAGGFTLAGLMTFSIWGQESNSLANCGGRARVFKRTAAGVESEVAGGPWSKGLEYTTSAREDVWTGTPTSGVAFAENDRLTLKVYITNVGTMGGSRTCTMTYNAANAATGDSFLQLTETVTFKAELVTQYGVAAMGGLGSLVAAGLRIVKGIIAISGLGALSAIGLKIAYGITVLAGAGTLTAAGTRAAPGQAALSGQGALSASGEVIAGVVTSSALLEGDGALGAAGHVVRHGQATLPGQGALGASGRGLAFGAAWLGGSGAASAAGSMTAYGQPALMGQGQIAVAGQRAVCGQAVMPGQGMLAASGLGAAHGAAQLSGAGDAGVTGTRGVCAPAQLAGLGALDAAGFGAAGHGIAYGQAALSGAGVLAAVGSRCAIGMASLTGVGILASSGYGTTALVADAASGREDYAFWPSAGVKGFLFWCRQHKPSTRADAERHKGEIAAQLAEKFGEFVGKGK